MAITAAHLASTFGILGNIISFMVFLSPLPTFYRIYKRKSTEGFQSIPYSVSLFSAMLYLYYAYLKKNALLLITINTAGCIIEIIYLAVFIAYATTESKVSATRLLVIFNFGTFGLIVVFTYVFAKGETRTSVVGWICAAFSVSVFAAPLAIMRKVVKSKSVEFMPFYLSFFLTVCAVTWFVYGLLIKDYYVATPNVLGFTFGIAQMVLYFIYKDEGKKIQPTETNLKQVVESDNNTKELTIHVVEIESMEVNQKEEESCKDQQTVALHPIAPKESHNDMQLQVFDHGELIKVCATFPYSDV